MNAEAIKPLSDQLAERITAKTAEDIAAALKTAHRAAFDAYQKALAPLFGQRFGVVVDEALAEAEGGIVAAVLPLAQRQAFESVVQKLTASV